MLMLSRFIIRHLSLRHSQTVLQKPRVEKRVEYSVALQFFGQAGLRTDRREFAATTGCLPLQSFSSRRLDHDAICQRF
jgi:hypothetical protein